MSTASSLYSTPEEKQSHEIRKLRRELQDAQEKVHTLTNQLSTNVCLPIYYANVFRTLKVESDSSILYLNLMSSLKFKLIFSVANRTWHNFLSRGFVYWCMFGVVVIEVILLFECNYSEEK